MLLPAVLLLPAASSAASIREADPTNCIDGEQLELELDQSWMPAEATVEVTTSVVAGAFGVDVWVSLDARTTWETRIPLRRADCSSAAETVALSVESGMRGRPVPTLGPRPPMPPPDVLLALGGMVGAGGVAPSLGVRAAVLGGRRGLQWEVGGAASQTLPLHLDPEGTAQLAEGLVTAAVGPKARLGGVRLRPALALAAGVGVASGAGLGVASRRAVPRLRPGVSFAVGAGPVHVGVSAGAEAIRIRYEILGGVDGDPTLEPVVRLGLELGLLSAGKVRAAGGPPDP